VWCVVVAQPFLIERCVGLREGSGVAQPLLIERCVGLREGSGVERPCAMIFTLLGLKPLFLWLLIPTA